MTRTGNSPNRRRGQVMIFYILALVILFFMVLWNFDLHKILHVKMISQNAGDSSSLMAARWQGITLNLIGDLNLMNAMALSDGYADTSASISNIQARLCFVGPMIGYLAAQQAAKYNGMYRNTDFDAILTRHATRVREDYPTTIGEDGEMLFPEPYPGCWEEYADMLDFIASEGVAAGADNAQYYTDGTGGHTLLTMGFYEAIAGKTWCWFYHNAPTLLEDYENFSSSWDALPEIPHQDYINSEIFSLGLIKSVTTLAGFLDEPTVAAALTDRELGGELNSTGMATTATWYGYDAERWTEWAAIATTGSDPFPATGSVKPQYDYTGADASVRVQAQAARLTPGAGRTSITNTITWTAAAKPFGYLNDEDRPDLHGLVLPAFRDVRLIPVDTSSAPSGGAYDVEWRTHVEEHLPDYMENGPRTSSCWYCSQLVTWENTTFREEGVEWLEDNSEQCTATGGTPGGRGGGTRTGH